MRCVSAAAAAAAAGPFTPISAREYRVTTRVARFNRLGRSFTPYLAPLCTPRMRERSSGKRSVASRRWRAGPREASGGSLPADRRSWREASFYVERGISGHCMHCSLWRGISSLGIRRSQMRHSSLPSRPSPERDALLLWRSCSFFVHWWIHDFHLELDLRIARRSRLRIRMESSIMACDGTESGLPRKSAAGEAERTRVLVKGEIEYRILFTSK